jgi:hypothetical protein
MICPFCFSWRLWAPGGPQGSLPFFPPGLRGGEIPAEINQGIDLILWRFVLTLFNDALFAQPHSTGFGLHPIVFD